MEKATDYDIEQILLLQLEAVKEMKKRDGAKINQELLEIQKTLGELEKQREV